MLQERPRAAPSSSRRLSHREADLPERVAATPAALALIAKLEAIHGPLMFHQSGGCCDGSAPMCYPRGDFRVGKSDVKLGSIGDAPFYMSESQFEYWKHTHLTIDVVPGRGSGFSLESPGECPLPHPQPPLHRRRTGAACAGRKRRGYSPVTIRSRRPKPHTLHRVRAANPPRLAPAAAWRAARPCTSAQARWHRAH